MCIDNFIFSTKEIQNRKESNKHYIKWMWKCELNEWNFIRFIRLVKVSGWSWEIHLAYGRQKEKLHLLLHSHPATQTDKQTTRQTDSQADQETNKPNDIISPKHMLWFQFLKEATRHKVFHSVQVEASRIGSIIQTYITVCLLGPDVARHSNWSLCLCVRVTKPNKI